MAIQFNIAQIKVTVAKDLNRRMEAAAQQRAREILEAAATDMLDEVLEHKITQEIEGGIQSENISGTLVGGGKYVPKNLYSFIGFNGGDEPIAEITSRLDPSHPEGPEMTYMGRQKTDMRYSFRVSIKRMRKAIHDATKISWLSGMSWVEKIESHIPGFAHFLPTFNRKNSRSGGGIQVEPELRPFEFTEPKEGYLSPIFNRFIEHLKSYGKAGFKRRRR